jgi:hypothetical protein
VRPLYAIALLLALVVPAAAQEAIGGSPPAFGENPPEQYESSQWFAFELKFGGYSPDIDSSPGLNGRKPFADLFNPQDVKGRPPWRLLTSFELDYQFLHKFGSLGVGSSVGFYRRTTHGFVYPTGSDGKLIRDPNTGAILPCQVPACQRSNDETGLNIIPLELMAVYRFDVLAHRYHVPLVPYVKLGLAYYIWWINNGDGFLSAAQFQPRNMNGEPVGKGQAGYGGTFGWVFNPGIAVMLDPIDPSAARSMDIELGINHTYLFCELHYADISGFGAKNKLVLSDIALNAGIAFEF